MISCDISRNLSFHHFSLLYGSNFCVLYVLTCLYQTTGKISLVKSYLWIVSLKVLKMLSEHILTWKHCIYCPIKVGALPTIFILVQSPISWVSIKDLTHRFYIENTIAVYHRQNSYSYEDYISSHDCYCHLLCGSITNNDDINDVNNYF